MASFLNDAGIEFDSGFLVVGFIFFIFEKAI